MAQDQITDLVTTSVTLGTPTYASALMITSTGSVTPIRYGATAVLNASGVSSTLDNAGNLTAGIGTPCANVT